MHIHIKYEVSIFNPVAMRAVHRCRCADANTDTNDDNNYARQTNHDYVISDNFSHQHEHT